MRIGRLAALLPRVAAGTTTGAEKRAHETDDTSRLPDGQCPRVVGVGIGIEAYHFATREWRNWQTRGT